MSDKITKLHVVPPATASDGTKASLIALLEEALAEARAGDITEAVIVVQHANPTLWSDRSSHLSNLALWVGRLEISKQDLIVTYKGQD